jgi:hypothetical protein
MSNHQSFGRGRRAGPRAAGSRPFRRRPAPGGQWEVVGSFGRDKARPSDPRRAARRRDPGGCVSSRSLDSFAPQLNAPIPERPPSGGVHQCPARRPYSGARQRPARPPSGGARCPQRARRWRVGRGGSRRYAGLPGRSRRASVVVCRESALRTMRSTAGARERIMPHKRHDTSLARTSFRCCVAERQLAPATWRGARGGPWNLSPLAAKGTTCAPRVDVPLPAYPPCGGARCPQRARRWRVGGRGSRRYAGLSGRSPRAPVAVCRESALGTMRSTLGARERGTPHGSARYTGLSARSRRAPVAGRHESALGTMRSTLGARERGTSRGSRRYAGLSGRSRREIVFVCRESALGTVRSTAGARERAMPRRRHGTSRARTASCRRAAERQLAPAPCRGAGIGPWNPFPLAAQGSTCTPRMYAPLPAYPPSGRVVRQRRRRVS